MVIDYRTVLFNLIDKAQEGIISDKQVKQLMKLEQWRQHHANKIIKIKLSR